MKICIVSSTGGHLLQILFFKKIFDKYNHFFVTFKRQDSINLAKKEKTYFVEDPKRNPIKLLKNTIQTLHILLRERPDVIITTGAGVAIPTCYLSKILGSKIVFIEDFCRTEDLSLSGKLVYPIADLFLVQWKKLSKKYKKVIYGGPAF